MQNKKFLILAVVAFLAAGLFSIYYGNGESGTIKTNSDESADRKTKSEVPASVHEQNEQASPSAVAAANQAFATSGISQEAFLNAKKEMDRVQAQYEEAMGLLPEKYRSMNDVTALRAMIEKGDKFAATRLGDILLDNGDASGAIENYRKSAELGAPAALTSIAMLLSPDDAEPARAYQEQKFGRLPQSDLRSAYVAAQVAYLRGHSEAFHLLDRLQRRIPRESRVDYEAAASLEHVRLMELYRQRYGRYPMAPISATQLQDDKMLLQVNYAPRKGQ
jgi:hypothetical protein